jgi:isopentenyl phosphate kinase
MKSRTEIQRQWRLRNPDKVKAIKARYRLKSHAKEAEYAAQKWRKFREQMSAYKLALGCVDCGYKGHPSALEFDHVTGKKSKSVMAFQSIKRAMEEVAKCVVRCANCHRIKTYNERQEKGCQTKGGTRRRSDHGR